MKTLAFVIGIFVAMVSTVCPASSKSICDSDRSLACLQANFNVLYKNNNFVFWEILHKSELTIKKTKNSTASFLKLADIKQVNAEFSEYYADVVEGIIEDKPNLFFDAMASLDKTTISNVLSYLKEPTFIDKSDLDRIFKKYSKKEKYSGGGVGSDQGNPL
jgi:hypothetical protein